MSHHLALEAIALRKTHRIPRWIGVPLHGEFLERLTGMDPTRHPREVSLRAIEALQLDVARCHDHLERPGLSGAETGWAGGVMATQFDGLATAPGGGLTPWTQPELHFEVEEVLDYRVDTHPANATEEEFAAGLLAAWDQHQADQQIVGDRAWIGDPVSWYNTVFMWGVTTFGWESFLLAAGLHPERYARLLDALTDITRRYFSAAAQLPGLRLAQAHDDLCITRGPVFHPRWYREYIFPLYPKVLAPLKQAGVKVVYRGDGKVDEFIGDLAAAGFDGFFVRSETDIGEIAARFGHTHIIIGNISTSVLTLGGKTEIYDEVRRCATQAGHCPGYFFHVAGEIPHNVPADNLFYLFEALDRFGRR